MEMVARGYRVNFTITYEMSEKAAKLAKEMNISLSEFARKALQQSIEKIEAAKLEQALIEGYKANSHYSKQEVKTWENVDIELR